MTPLSRSPVGSASRRVSLQPPAGIADVQSDPFFAASGPALCRFRSSPQCGCDRFLAWLRRGPCAPLLPHPATSSEVVCWVWLPAFLTATLHPLRKNKDVD